MKPTPLDMLLHSISLHIATANSMAVNVFGIPTVGEEEDISEDLVMAYRLIRRHITKGEDGRRFGSAAAYAAMVNGEI